MINANTDFLKVEYENDRLRFLGRNNTVQSPCSEQIQYAIFQQYYFSDNPIISLRARVVLPAFGKVSVYFITGKLK